MRYIVVKSYKIENLVNAVNQRVEEGWTPLGGIAISMAGSTMGSFLEYEYAQAMLNKA